MNEIVRKSIKLDEPLTLRDFLAVSATEEDIKPYLIWDNVRRTNTRNREEAKYAYADAMLRARDVGR